MEPVHIVQEIDIPWVEGRSMVKDGKRIGVHNRAPIAQVDPGPWLGRSRYDPGMVVAPHRHPSNEIIFIVAGDMTVAGTSYGQGTAIAIKAGTVYGPLVAGPHGVEFLLIFDRDPKRGK